MTRKHDVRRGDGYVQNRVTKSGEVRYQARWKEPGANGRPIWRSKTFGHQEDAEDHLRKVGREIRAGKYTPESKITVQEAVNNYLERGRSRWSSNTYASYMQVAEMRLIPYLGKVRLSELTAWQVQDWIDELTANKYKPSSVRNSRIVLMGTCKEAVRLGILQINPVSGTQMPKQKKRKPTIWSADEIDSVMNAVKNNAMMTAFYAVALTSAMRPGELRNLKWKHIDFDEKTILCEVSVTRDENFRQIEGTSTKTGKSRFIALSGSAEEALLAYRQEQVARRLKTGKWADRDLIFDRGDGRLMPGETMHWKHRLAIAAAGVSSIRLHDLRHSAVTHLLRSGVPLEVVSKMLGHASLAITIDVYGHIDVSMQRTAVDIMGALVKRRVT